MTEKQKKQLLGKVKAQWGLIKSDLLKGLEFVSSICLVDIGLDYIDFYKVKDKQENNKIRAVYGMFNNIMILDNNILDYKLEKAEDYVELFEKLFILLNKKYEENNQFNNGNI